MNVSHFPCLKLCPQSNHKCATMGRVVHLSSNHNIQSSSTLTAQVKILLAYKLTEENISQTCQLCLSASLHVFIDTQEEEGAGCMELVTICSQQTSIHPLHDGKMDVVWSPKHSMLTAIHRNYTDPAVGPLDQNLFSIPTPFSLGDITHH